MKSKLSLLGLLTLAGLAATPTESQAWGLLANCCRDRLDHYSTYICCRPYNAFTPVCFGTITCNGCAPVMMQPPVVPNYSGWMPQGPYGPGCCGPSGCCGPTFSTGDGCGPGLPVPMDPNACAPQYGVAPYGMPPQGAPHAMPQGPMPPYAGQPYPGLPIQQQNYTMPQPPPHTAGYQPGYQVPGYYVQPVSYYPMWPTQPVVPNYWYGR